MRPAGAARRVPSEPRSRWIVDGRTRACDGGEGRPTRPLMYRADCASPYHGIVPPRCELA
eukprot:scaffold28963_cov63-Phaeocystis_antarctica.AAC.6